VPPQRRRAPATRSARDCIHARIRGAPPVR
jgi:hypothetical protein